MHSVDSVPGQNLNEEAGSGKNLAELTAKDAISEAAVSAVKPSPEISVTQTETSGQVADAEKFSLRAKSLGLTIKVGTPADLPELLGLIKELATFELQPDAVTNTIEKMKADGFGPNPVFGFFMARLANGNAVGMAVWYIRYSTWKGRALYLEDIYIKPEHRALGIGHSLLETIREEALRQGCDRVCLQVLDWNKPAIDFYMRHGAVQDPEWINCVLPAKSQ
ncbi:MAG: GNAT family N-acetyltransferase [Bacteroidota bacterium]